MGKKLMHKVQVSGIRAVGLYIYNYFVILGPFKALSIIAYSLLPLGEKRPE